MTDKEQLRKEFDALECNTILSEIEMNDRDTLFNWFLSKLESKDKEIAELKTIINEELAKNRKQFKEIAELREKLAALEKLLKYFYQHPDIRWHMKYEINKKFPELVKILNT